MWVIAKREFIERVRSKWFVVMTILWPLLMVAMIVIPALLGGKGTAGAKVVVLDKSGILGETAQGMLAAPPPLGLEWKTSTIDPSTPESELRRRIRNNDINGYLVIAANALDGGTIVYNGDNASNQTVQIQLHGSMQLLVFQKRAERAGIKAIQMPLLFAPVDVKAKHTTGEEEGRTGIFVFIIGYFLAFLIYIAITLYGITVMRSIVSEKSNKVVELLVAATKPRSMMAGKILGVGAAGLAQIGIWIVLGAIAITNRDIILGWFGASPGKGPDLPSLTIDQVAVTLACFVLGYLFYSAMYAAVGAMVATEQDSQQAQMPVTFLLVIGIITMQVVINDPRGSTTEIVTMVPFWSPMLMPLRYFLGGATGGQVALSLGILTVSTYLVARAAAKIYRVGILMYGKRPNLRELVRWLRY
jgi:ABC-2 type transport system permease protein